MKSYEIENIFCEDCMLRLKTGFKTLKKDELELLDYEKSCRFFKKGEIIYREGFSGNGVYCINKGIVKIFKTGIDGKEQILKLAKAGDLIAFRSILSNELSCSTAQVIEDSVLCFIPNKIFLKFAMTNPQFSMHLIRLSCKELGESNKYILDLAQKNIRERVAEVILLLKETFDEDKDGYMNVSLSREEIANIVGTATESTIRQLSDLKKEKVIDLIGKKIKIIDLKKLTRISGI